MNQEQIKQSIETESLLKQEAKAGISRREPEAVNIKFGEDVVRNKNDPEVKEGIIKDEKIKPMDTLQSELYIESKYQARRHERLVEEPKAKEAEVPLFKTSDSVKEVKFDVKKNKDKLNKTKFSNKKPGKSLNEDEGKVKRKNSVNSRFETVNKAKEDNGKLFKVSEDKLSETIAEKRKTNTKLTEEELRQKAYFTSKLDKEEEGVSLDISKDDAVVYRTQQKLKRQKNLSNTSRIRHATSSLSATKYHVSNGAGKLTSYADSNLNKEEMIQEETAKATYDTVENSKFGVRTVKRTKDRVSRAIEQKRTENKVVNSRFIPVTEKKVKKDIVSDADMIIQEKKNLKKFLIAKKKDEIIFTDIKTNLARKIVSKIKQIAARNKIGVVIAAVILAFSLASLGSVGVIIQGLAQGSSTYLTGLSLSTDFDMTDCENYFTKMEADLQEEIDNIEEFHPGFDSYEIVFDDEIGHDALKLMAYLSAVYEGYDLSMIQEVLDKLFEYMYVVEREELTKEVDGEEISVFKMTITKTDWDELMSTRITEDDGDLYESYEEHGGGHQTLKNPFSINWKNKITSEFGWRIHPITGEEKFHRGVDIGMPAGTDVMSCSEGIVVKSTYTDVEGNYVVVEDESGYRCSYMHLSVRNVSVGDKVDYSTIIGKVGSTGRSTGPHLHLQITDNNGELLNPRFLVEGGY